MTDAATAEAACVNLDEHLERIRIGREALNLEQLPDNPRKEADTSYLEHYGVDLRK